MVSVRNSIAARLALGYGLLLAASVAIVSAVFYFGTIGVLAGGIDGKIASISERMAETLRNRTQEDVASEIARQLNDGIDSDTEILLVVSADGQRIAGNLSSWPDAATPRGQLVTRSVVRYDRPTSARLVVRDLDGGRLLVVGRDLSEQDSIRMLVWRALGAGAAVSLVLVLVGAMVFHRQLEGRIGEIRRTALEIGAGKLSRRVPISGDDEFGRLSLDINRMLDRIEQLMNGVRHVSNAIAHDLRTPLGRIRSRLEEAAHGERDASALSEAARGAVEGIDDLILLFDKLLQIAEAESGMRTHALEPVDLNGITHDMAELYDAAAEEMHVTLKASGETAVMASGDHDLLASAVASLIDNAIKYAGAGATVEVRACAEADGASVTVRDNGPGIPPNELPRVTERFYRLDSSRHLPGNGLGLSIVAAIATLHGGRLSLEDGKPGLVARLILPADAPRSPLA